MQVNTKIYYIGAVAQWLELMLLNLLVVGSNPTGTKNFQFRPCLLVTSSILL